MPIRFRCPRCDRKLKAKSFAVGKVVNCPGCHAEISIPSENAASTTLAMRDAEEVTGTESAGDIYTQFVVYDEDEIDFDTGEVVSPNEPQPVDYVVLPHKVIYIQGALLGVLSIIVFGLGLWCGVLLDSPTEKQMVYGGVFGTVTFATTSGNPQPDIGVVVMALPVETLPDEKIQPGAFRPDKPPPSADHHGVLSIAALGGQFTRADTVGKYRVANLRPGMYFILYLTGNVRRNSGDLPDSADLAELGRYFISPTKLLGNCDYHWQKRRITGEHRWDMHFEVADVTP